MPFESMPCTSSTWMWRVTPLTCTSGPLPAEVRSCQRSTGSLNSAREAFFQKERFFHFDRRHGQHGHALSFAEGLQENLARVFETHAIAVGVCVRGCLDEPDLFHFTHTEFALQTVWDIPQNQF